MRESLAALAAKLAQRSGLLVVDEAFADVLPVDVSLAPALPPSTLVLRSFGKAYGLAGLRLGFAIAAPDLVDRLRDELGPWAVSGDPLRTRAVTCPPAAPPGLAAAVPLRTRSVA